VLGTSGGCRGAVVGISGAPCPGVVGVVLGFIWLVPSNITCDDVGRGCDR
jgi:hypothetical protein